MRKNSGFVATAVLTLALAISGNTAIFTIVHAVLLNPLPYDDSEQLVRNSGGATPTRFAEMRLGARSFAELGAYAPEENVTLSGRTEPEIIKGVHVSANFLRILKVEPARGRAFRAEEDTPGAAVAMISAELWERRFGGDPRILGKPVTLDSASYTIVGVLPPRFQFPFPGLDVWMTSPAELPSIPPKSRALSPFLTIFGRLKPGMTLSQADAEMKVLRRQYAAGHPAMLDAKPKNPRELSLFKDELVSNVRRMLWLMFGAVVFVLMIACANLASLLLARAASREREFAVRSALGASGGRMVQQLLTESLLLSLAGGFCGVLIAALVLRAIPYIALLEIPRTGEIRIDWVVLTFAVALSFATGVTFGLAPSIGASRPDLARLLRASGEAAHYQGGAAIMGAANIRSLLSVLQTAFSVVLLIGATLLIETVAHLRNVPVGFNPAHLLTVNVSLSPARYDTDQKVATFFKQACHRLAALPGVDGVAAALSLPMMAYPGTPVQDAAKPPLPLNERLISKIFLITPTYFRTLEIPLRRGREFTLRDTKNAQGVAIIDENLAHRLWPAYPAGLNPIGQRLLVGGVNAQPAEIVGIVANTKQNLDDREGWQETVYVPFAQDATASAMLALRTEGDPLAVTHTVAEHIRALNPDQAVGDVKTMEDRIEAELGQPRVLGGILGIFALAALLLSLIGIYGVIAYSVTHRIPEMAIRRALGAQQNEILRLIIGQAFVLSSIGIALGMGCALGLTRLLRNLLFGVTPADPVTYACVGLLFLVVALAASYIPARRATRADPIAALRG